MTDLNEEQFAQYSAIQVPDKIHEYEYKPLPASMERHAPGEYQPTLPGMEHMLKGEQTHTSVFFKHPNAGEPFEIAGKTYQGDVPGSDWHTLTTTYYPKHEDVEHNDLHPVQDWVDDKYIHSAPNPRTTMQHEEGRPLVERIGPMRVLMDGHHRVVRSILQGEKNVNVASWGHE